MFALKVLLGFLEDIMKHKEDIMKASPEEPFYVIELGTGSGKFSFFMLKALMEFETTCSFPLDNICYVMTDFTESNFKVSGVTSSLFLSLFSTLYALFFACLVLARPSRSLPLLQPRHSGFVASS